MLDFVLELSNLSLKLRLQAVRGAFARCLSLVVDGEVMAAVGWWAVVEVGVETALPGAGWWAGELEGGGVGFAAAVEGEDVVETHGWCWVLFGGGFCWWRLCWWLLGVLGDCGRPAGEGRMRMNEWDVGLDISSGSVCKRCLEVPE